VEAMEVQAWASNRANNKRGKERRTLGGDRYIIFLLRLLLCGRECSVGKGGVVVVVVGGDEPVVILLLIVGDQAWCSCAYESKATTRKEQTNERKTTTPRSLQRATWCVTVPLTSIIVGCRQGSNHVFNISSRSGDVVRTTLWTFTLLESSRSIVTDMSSCRTLLSFA